jgi:tRNA(Ser,Leu) C12 N-acetylase TAN1
MTTAWNVVASVRPGEFLRAKQLLERFGTVKRSDYFNVLLLHVDDVREFLAAYLKRSSEDPRLAQCISRLAPLKRAFEFSDVSDFETKVRGEVMAFVSDLKGKSFHVRMNRRGFKHDLSSQREEQSLDHALLEELARQGSAGRITFDDPDAVLDIETVGQMAGVSLWSREDLRGFPFLKVD